MSEHVHVEWEHSQQVDVLQAKLILGETTK